MDQSSPTHSGLRLVCDFGEFAFEPERGTIRRPDGSYAELRPKTAKLLSCLIGKCGLLVSRNELLEVVWSGAFVTDDSITQCVTEIRRALGPKGAKCVRTLPKRGYILDATVAPTAFADGLLDTKRAVPAFANLPSSHTHHPSILVLPIRSLDGSDVSERVAERITDDILVGLTRHVMNSIPGLMTVAFRDARLGDWRDAGFDHNARYVIRGNIRGRKRLFMNVQLLELKSGVCLWVKQCAATNPHDLIAQLIEGIWMAVVQELARSSAATSATAPQDLIIQGQALLLRSSSPGNRRYALQNYRRALEINPGLANAKVGIATVLTGNLVDGWSGHTVRDEEEAELLLQEVIQSGVNTAEILGIMGALRRYQGRLDESQADLAFSLDLDPYSTLAANQFGVTLLYFGEPEAALPHLERVVRQTSQDPRQPTYRINLGLCYLLLGDVDAAIEQLRWSVVGNPDHFGGPLLLTAALGLKFGRERSSWILKRLITDFPQFSTQIRMRRWVVGQGNAKFMPMYEHMIERGFDRAGMAVE